MKIGPYVEKLEKSKEYKNFIVKYPDSFLIAGFFVLDFENGTNIHQIDFYVPKEKKIAAFTLDGQVKMQLLNTLNTKVPEKLDLNVTIDLDNLSYIIKDEMHNRNISEDIRKMIAIIQNIDGRKIWNLNCVLTGMEILKTHVEDESKTILKFEKESFMDIMKRLPMPNQNVQIKSEKNSKEALEQLNALETELAKEKKQLEEKLRKEKIIKEKKKR